MTALIEARGLSVAYGPAAPVLSHVDFTLQPGEIVTIVGPNGSGKSTLLRALLDMVPATQGRVTRAPDLRVSAMGHSSRSSL